MHLLLKQLVDVFTAPLMLAMVLLLIGLVCRWRSWRRLAGVAMLSAVAIAYLGSMSVMGDALIARLERQFPALLERNLPATVTTIVVLGSGYRPEAGLPVTSAFDEEGLARIVEGVRLWRQVPGAKLVVSGGAPPTMTPSALGYARLAREFGVPEDRLTVLDRPLDTNQEALALAGLLQSTPFVLVTSASHMPRAMALMRRSGANAIPAPTGHRAIRKQSNCWRCWLPAAAGLRKTERALHEYLGLAAMQLGFE